MHSQPGQCHLHEGENWFLLVVVGEVLFFLLLLCVKMLLCATHKWVHSISVMSVFYCKRRPLEKLGKNVGEA